MYIWHFWNEGFLCPVMYSEVKLQGKFTSDPLIVILTLGYNSTQCHEFK